MTSSSDTCVFRLLSGEWERTARTRKANQAFQSWKAAEPALAPVESLSSLLRVRAEMRPPEANAVLGALLRIGDDLALRAFLQIMLPTIGSLTRYVGDKEWIGSGRPWATRAEVDQDLLGRAWAWLHERRGTSITWPAPTLSMCLLHAAQRTTVTFYKERNRVEQFSAPVHDRPARSSDRWTAEEDAIKLVCDAVEAGILPLGCAQLLYRVRVRGEGYTELAEALGRSEAALKQQCKRAGDRLRPLVAVA
jgi:DNA-directed RNA polymerase specialized sigma24 family protein